MAFQLVERSLLGMSKVDVPIMRQPVLWVIHTNVEVSNYWVNVLYLMRVIIQIIVTTTCCIFM